MHKDACKKYIKKGYKKTTEVWTWDNPVHRIEVEKGVTLYAEQQFSDWNNNRTTYPAYKYKVTFELIETRPQKWTKKIYNNFKKVVEG